MKKDLQEIIRNTAKNCGIPLKEGVYVQTTGPNYETPEEIRMYRSLGADAVGMSTACEAMAANHMGMRVCGISCISNLAAGISETSADTCGDPGDGRPGGTAVSAADHGIHSEYCKPVE